MIRHRIAAIAATTVAVLGIVGVGFAYAASTVNVPNANGQLTGTVYECVNAAHEGWVYVELGHPAPGNCAAGWLQFTANQPAASSSSSAPNVNSESFTGTKGATTDTFNHLSIPPGSHITAVTGAIDLDASAASPVTVTVTSFDNVTGVVSVKYSVALPAADTIQITYDYQL